jgi:putative redox protein
MSAALLPEPQVAPGTVVVAERGDGGLAQYLLDGRHSLIADEPGEKGGLDRGPGPYELLLMGLGACTSMTLRLYANRKQWPLERIVVRLSHARDYSEDCATCDTKTVMLDHIDCTIELKGRLDDDQRTRLLSIANQCPIHRTLTSKIVITSKVTAAL